jgi:hypothetical protein
MHIYEVRPRKDKGGVDLVSDALPFGRLCYGEPSAISNAIDYAKFYSRSHDAVIRVYDEAGNVIQLHAHKGRERLATAIRATRQGSRGFSIDDYSRSNGSHIRRGLSSPRSDSRLRGSWRCSCYSERFFKFSHVPSYFGKDRFQFIHLIRQRT